MFSKHGLWSRLSVLLLISIFFTACDGSDGAAGPAGPAGSAGPPGPEGPPGTGLDPLEAAKIESCATCHGGVGDEHQAIYDGYVDASALDMTFSTVTSVPDGAGGFDVTLAFSITKNGLPFVDAAGLPSLDQKRFYAVQYDSATGQYLNGNTRLRETNVVPGAVAGDYVLTQTGVPFAPETPLAPFDGSQVYGYIAQGPLLRHAGDTGAELPAGSHVHLYEDVANTALAFGTAAVTDPNAYVSAANVTGCATCHGTPYMKHGYRDPLVAALPDFASCKSCHYDDRNGGHEDWQYMVDDPLNWATDGLPAAEVETKYAYKAKLMNDVHMAHAMEFPYPQSMANCATCHECKVDQVLANTNFTPETCLSCHPVQGVDAWPEMGVEGQPGFQAEGAYYQSHRAPALEYLWTRGADLSFHDPVANPNCQACHGAGVSRPFNEIHSGYDPRISNDAGARYADLFTASIDDVSVAGDVLTISYSADESAISNAVAGSLEVHVYVSFYGWGSKQFVVPSHQRDDSVGCSGGTRGCRFEYAPGDTNPLFPSFQEVAPGSYVLTADMAAFQAVVTDDIPTMIANGDVKTAEITLAPRLDVDVDVAVGLNAVTQTFDLGAAAFVADYFKGDNAVVDTNKCNVCHDQLAVTFHSGRGRGGDIVACKNCHAPVFPGSHLEMASRSIENYVHGIHSFQDFDPGDTFETFDPVLAKRYDLHINHTFPNFTIRNCEACHKPGTYNVPDQSQSLPGVLSKSDNPATWYDIVGGLAVENTAGRNISGSVPEFVTGPASRACGGCHRADLINPDRAGDLSAFNAHTEAGGTFVENDAEDTVLYGIIDKIMTLFE